MGVDEFFFIDATRPKRNAMQVFRVFYPFCYFICMNLSKHNPNNQKKQTVWFHLDPICLLKLLNFPTKVKTLLVSFSDVLIIPGWSDSRLAEVPPDLPI